MLMAHCALKRVKHCSAVMISGYLMFYRSAPVRKVGAMYVIAYESEVLRVSSLSLRTQLQAAQYFEMTKPTFA